MFSQTTMPAWYYSSQGTCRGLSRWVCMFCRTLCVAAEFWWVWSQRGIVFLLFVEIWEGVSLLQLAALCVLAEAHRTEVQIDFYFKTDGKRRGGDTDFWESAAGNDYIHKISCQQQETVTLNSMVRNLVTSHRKHFIQPPPPFSW